MTQPGRSEKIAVVVGTVTDDKRIHKVPKLRVCALNFTENARARILQAGGEVMTFDQLAIKAPLGQNTQLLQGLYLPQLINQSINALFNLLCVVAQVPVMPVNHTATSDWLQVSPRVTPSMLKRRKSVYLTFYG
jgi:Ribosomal protein 60S L18 and 50S L18e